MALDEALDASRSATTVHPREGGGTRLLPRVVRSKSLVVRRWVWREAESRGRRRQSRAGLVITVRRGAPTDSSCRAAGPILHLQLLRSFPLQSARVLEKDNAESRP